MITRTSVVNQKIEGQTAFIKPIAKTFQLSGATKVQRSAEQLQPGVDRLKFQLKRFQAIMAASYQYHLTRHRGKLTREFTTDPGGCSGNQDRISSEIADAHTLPLNWITARSQGGGVRREATHLTRKAKARRQKAERRSWDGGPNK
jgi:hypothetical protein